MKTDGGFDTDVVVIGGGPAGSTAAALLAMAGRRVILFEKERFPRFHIGESLLPFNIGLFRRLGIEDRIAGRFVEKKGAVVASSDASISQYIRFSEGLEPGHAVAFQVIRSEFDRILLDNAAARGADVRQGTPVLEASTSHREGCEVSFRAPSGSPGKVRGRFLLDATGQEAFIAARLCLSGSRRISDLRSARDFSYACDDIAGDGYLLLGDAAAFIDPIFSSGVWLAMSSAEAAADRLHEALGRPGAPGNLAPRAFRSYRKLVVRHVRTYARLVDRFYRPGFMDVFLNPTERFGLEGAVISLLAGCVDPKPLMRLRLALFYAVLRVQRHLNLLPPVGLLGTLERPDSDRRAGEVT